MIASYVAWFSYASFRYHDLFLTNGFDFGIFDYMVWNNLHGNFFSGLFIGEKSHLSLHFQLILLPLAPIYLIWPDAKALLFIQSLVLGLGALPIYWLAESRLNRWMGVGFAAVYPLALVKAFGAESVKSIQLGDLLMGRQIGGLGATFGLGLILGGCYLMIRGFIRPEISLTFLAGIYFTALLFNLADPARFAEPGIHLLSGYTLIGAFFLATEDGSSPVNVIPMLIYGAVGGIMTVLIRNIGAYIDGVILAILLINLISPLLDRIRPQALGKVV